MSGHGGSLPTLDPWLEGLIANGDMIKANVSSGLDRGDVLFVEMDDNRKLRTTWKEIMQAMIAGKLVVVREMNFAGITATVEFDVLTYVGFTENDGFYIYGQGNYYADGVDDAPVRE